MVKNLNLNLSFDDINSLNVLALAYIGDSVWEMYVRDYVIAHNKSSKVNKLHLLSTKYVKAKSQADIVKKLKENEIINDELWNMVLRGRNNSNKPPKNADVQDYNYATGFETMIGYVYLKGDFEKLDEIASFCLENIH